MKFFKPHECLPRLNRIFSVEKQRILAILPSAEVEHIGSSAIFGALTKGDLDILVRVPKTGFDQALNALLGLAYHIKVDTLRTESLCMLESLALSDVAIQLIETGSQFENFVRFRDRLNANSTLVEQYNQLKLDSTALSETEYRQRKSQFIENICSRP